MICGAIRRCRLVVWPRHTPRRRLDWHRNSSRRGPDPKPDRLLERAALEHGLTHLCRLTANLLRPVPIGAVTITVAADYVGRNAGHFSAQLIARAAELR